jgi:hypothetical protein
MVLSLRKFVRNTRLHADAIVRHLSNASMFVISREIQGNSDAEYPRPTEIEHIIICH